MSAGSLCYVHVVIMCESYLFSLQHCLLIAHFKRALHVIKRYLGATKRMIQIILKTSKHVNYIHVIPWFSNYENLHNLTYNTTLSLSLLNSFYIMGKCHFFSMVFKTKTIAFFLNYFKKMVLCVYLMTFRQVKDLLQHGFSILILSYQ